MKDDKPSEEYLVDQCITQILMVAAKKEKGELTDEEETEFLAYWLDKLKNA